MIYFDVEISRCCSNIVVSRTKVPDVETVPRSTWEVATHIDG